MIDYSEKPPGFQPQFKDLNHAVINQINLKSDSRQIEIVTSNGRLLINMYDGAKGIMCSTSKLSWFLNTFDENLSDVDTNKAYKILKTNDLSVEEIQASNFFLYRRDQYLI